MTTERGRLEPVVASCMSSQARRCKSPIDHSESCAPRAQPPHLNTPEYAASPSRTQSTLHDKWYRKVEHYGGYKAIRLDTQMRRTSDRKEEADGNNAGHDQTTCGS